MIELSNKQIDLIKAAVNRIIGFCAASDIRYVAEDAETILMVLDEVEKAEIDMMKAMHEDSIKAWVTGKTE